jgi:hypothetical protein
MALDYVVLVIGAAAAALVLTALFGVHFRSTAENWVDQYWGDGSIRDEWAIGGRLLEETASPAATSPTQPAATKAIVAEIFMARDAAPLEYGAVVDHVRFMSDYNLDIIAEPASLRATVRAPIGYAVDVQQLRLSLLAVAGDAGVERVSTSGHASCSSAV